MIDGTTFADLEGRVEDMERTVAYDTELAEDCVEWVRRHRHRWESEMAQARTLSYMAMAMGLAAIMAAIWAVMR